MESKTCMNEACRATTSSELKKGWSLKSGGFATLCYECGSAYENSVFCEMFHSEESGWRECRICGKIVHCGCIASRHVYEYMEFGGVACIGCAKPLEIHSTQPTQIPADIPNDKIVPTSFIGNSQPLVVENRIDNDKFSTERLVQSTNTIGVNNVTSPVEQLTREESILKAAESNKHVPLHCSPPAFIKANNSRPNQGVKLMYELLAKPSVNISLTTLGSMPPTGGCLEGNEQSRSSAQHGQRGCHISPKPPKRSRIVGPETSKGASSQTCVPRPPADRLGRIQLLPRYWPKITDQELQQLSGDLKSNIVPLFEKILSASDAGRIGRLVLPKACAEAYFPTINQSEGIPIKIQDIKGKEWTFQFRFWPNNNSRMYVLEGITPCIQKMQLQAGDTVIFSRRDPEGQLVIGCRKATNNVDVQDSQTPAALNNDSPGEASFTGAADTLLSNGGKVSDESQQQHRTTSGKKGRNIKKKRLLMHNNDATELRVTWGEAQELFRPSPSAKPTVIMVEDHEFEEFEEPPVFGKRTIFFSRPSGSGCSRSVPEDINPRDLDFFSVNKDHKKQKISDSESSGLDALANAAVLGENIGGDGESSAGATTRHPRHRPGCTCIVCIQPPSGKGKHEPTCKCNVCVTVRRRFKTLMMRKKKRQSEREVSELVLEKDKSTEKLNLEKEGIARLALLNMNGREDGTSHNGTHTGLEEASKGQALDFNCGPHREDEILVEMGNVGLTTLIDSARFPLDVFLGPNERPGLGTSVDAHTSEMIEENVGDGGMCVDARTSNAIEENAGDGGTCMDARTSNAIEENTRDGGACMDAIKESIGNGGTCVDARTSDAIEKNASDGGVCMDVVEKIVGDGRTCVDAHTSNIVEEKVSYGGTCVDASMSDAIEEDIGDGSTCMGGACTLHAIEENIGNGGGLISGDMERENQS